MEVKGMTLRELRLAKGFNQMELARLIGVSNKVIGHYETGRAMPSLPVAVRLARVLDTTVETIFECVEVRRHEQERSNSRAGG